MGLPKKKFSLSSLRLKPPSPSLEAATNYDIDTSPPYSPMESEMERPIHTHSLIADLREACAIIVNETNPPDPDEEPEHGEVLRRKFEEARKVEYVVQARPAEVKTREVVKPETAIPRSESRMNEKAQRAAARRVEAETRKAMAKEAEPERRKVIAKQAEIRLEMSGALQKSEPNRDQQTYVPKNVAANFVILGGKRGPSDTYNPTIEPIEPTHTKMSAKALGKQKEIDSASPRSSSQERSATTIEYLPPVHATIVQNTRNKPKDSDHPTLRGSRDNEDPGTSISTAVRADESGQSGESSKSTTRSNTEYDNRGRPTSTAITSAVITPGEDKTFLYNRPPSDDELSEEEDLRPHAKVWQAHKEALRRAKEKYQQSGRAGRTGSRASWRSKISRMDSDTEDERPPSRASSIAGSISNYLRPRASQDSMRSGRTSASGMSGSESRSSSRSSSMSRRSGNGWWKGSGLRRRGSWASFRSARPDGDKPNKLRKDGGPNLNRPLPALPGLDQYRETKTHIGQLMKAGARGRKKEKTPRPGINNYNPNAAYPNPYQPNQSQDQGAGHVKKESISGPVLRNSSMERTLHRYRDSQIKPSVPISLSQSQTHLPHRFSATSLSKEHQAQKHRLDSTTSTTTSGGNIKIPKTCDRGTSSRSTSRQKNYTIEAQRRGRGESTTSTSSKKKLRNEAPPRPIIRGPSYHKEVEQGVYPRPMEVGKRERVEGEKDNGGGGRGLKGIFGKRERGRVGVVN